VLLWLLLVSACTTYTPPDAGGSAVSSDSVIVLGVVSSDPPLSAFKRKEYADRLEAQIRTHQSRYNVVAGNDWRRYVNQRGGDSGNLSLVLGQYRLYGKLNAENLAILQRQGLPARYVVVARIENNETRKFREINNYLRNNRGELLTDRREVALIHQREVQVATQVYDLVNGGLVWSEYYTSKPEAKNVYVEYTGSSFVGSVANSLANSFVKGRTASRFPAAPREADAVLATFRRIGQQIFQR